MYYCGIFVQSKIITFDSIFLEVMMLKIYLKLQKKNIFNCISDYIKFFSYDEFICKKPCGKLSEVMFKKYDKIRFTNFG